MNKKPVILLTSSINPKNYSFVGRKGMEIRLKDYEDSIRFYLSKDFRIVFVDNTNSELKDPWIIHHKNFEFHKFLTEESFKGKGHGELEIMQFAISSSRLIKEENYFIKISGRYIIENIEQILIGINDLESYHYCNFSRNLFWADTRIMVLSKYFFENYFKPTCDKYLDESNGKMFENIYARAIHLWMYNGRRIKLFSVPPFYNSFNGVTNQRIFYGWIKKIKYQIYQRLKLWIFKQYV